MKVARCILSFLLLVCALALARSIKTSADASEPVTYIDSGGAGYASSVRLDANGFPVVSYVDSNTGMLKLLHCFTWTCEGGSYHLQVLDSGASVTALRLDGNGFPVIAYGG